MSSDLPNLFLARHGDTAWTDSRQHTGRTDILLNERGEEHARQMGDRLRGFSFVRVFTSPCNVLRRPVNWPDLEACHKLIPISPNGIMASWKVR